jgi:hypothetical protein
MNHRSGISWHRAARAMPVFPEHDVGQLLRWRTSRMSAVGCRLMQCALLIAASACSEPPSMVEWRGEHVLLVTPPGVVPCQSTLTRYDAYVERLSVLFGAQTVEDYTVYYLPSDDDFSDSPCSAGTSGCAIPGEHVAYIREARSVEHELTHLVAGPVLGIADDYLAEGLAELLGRSTQVGWAASDYAEDPREAVEAESSEIDYASAGYFSQFLADQYGMPKLLELYKTNAKSGPLTLRDSFQELFGERFDDVAETFLAQPVHCVEPEFDCSLGETHQLSATWDVDLSMGCESPGAVGYSYAYDPDREIQATDSFMLEFRVNFAQVGHRRVRSSSSQTWLSACSTCQHVQVPGPGGTSATVDGGPVLLRLLSSRGGMAELVSLSVEATPVREER